MKKSDSRYPDVKRKLADFDSGPRYPYVKGKMRHFDSRLEAAKQGWKKRLDTFYTTFVN